MEGLPKTFFDLILAVVLGGVLGIEREFSRKAAGLRTFSLISLSACLYILASRVGFMSFAGTTSFDPSRTFGQLIVGVGFLGAGMIFMRGGRVGGLTTAAMVWTAAAIGGTVGLELYGLAIGTTVLALLIVYLFYPLEQKIKQIREVSTPGGPQPTADAPLEHASGGKDSIVNKTNPYKLN